MTQHHLEPGSVQLNQNSMMRVSQLFNKVKSSVLPQETHK